MSISRKNVESILALGKIITGGKWKTEVTVDGTEIYTEKECRCEEDCFFDCMCDSNNREILGGFDIRLSARLGGVDQGVLDAEFICLAINNIVELARAYLELLDEERGDSGD
jgi:hypothetical protein